VANGNQYGNEFRIAPFANLNDGLLDVVIFKKQSFGGLIKNIIKQVSHLQQPTAIDQLNTERKLLYFHTKQLSIETGEKTPFHIDGDPAGFPNKIDIKIIPAAYQLLRNQ
jgi:diacylglycerol kinase family enzyme